ncbi:probable cation-transporting ATPase 1 [Zygosaccharomyces bailii ISA1307]|uniref:ZYBA0S09-01552g1_1 n=1 Tax=Zygosaccharomyces bailii (strain CLIB 213 / ATCC 58445 / CBS 680 / BCRC 21525 / NBRC 1098 / NCYC 1416 / NRRL Y-2227) TaxID=1333698 RepID=A0A8J2T9X5_ZYGB2|nr:ZYBA0S09-01552g1_1 [Zygosaccharomyces bailii CLIB 213]CDH09719.1 probable cation-transporting ATPase 1 [Zygosaccharomyces bailii ISA1307]
MPPKSLVASPLVRDSRLLSPKPFLSRPYVLFFLPLYATFAHIYYKQYDRYIKGSEWTFVYLGTIISLNVLVWLMPEWNVGIEAGFKFITATELAEATHILIKTTENNGADDIVEIHRVEEDGVLQIFFQFQKKRFLWHADEEVFASPKFLIDEPPKLGLLQKWEGNKGDLSHLRRLYGDNSFDIPIPTFLELFKEHAVAPLFVFQVFCVALWLLDEFWYYALFNMFTIVSMEAASVFQRLVTLKEFRTMGVKPFPIYVYRDNKWTSIESDKLLPMDIVSVTRTAEDSAVPCDMLLLDGSCIVNEAMLSGESTPLLKESIKLRPKDESLQVNGLDKNSVLHGGTKILQVTPPETQSHLQPSPDKGSPALVTKTGFETSQGSLVRVMIYSAERVGVDNREALFFILFLLIFAIVASWYVWVEGSKMGRIQSKLILDCVLIITSVVPPELPIELTMAVNSSLAALSKFYVYCTEPFRIPFAGRIDVCCFDKTGTLTGEDLVFEGLAGLSKDPKDIRHMYMASEAPERTSVAIGAAHALVKLDDGDVVGDPMEKATLNALGWIVEHKNVTTKEGLGKITIQRRFQFSSALKRSASIACHQGKHLAAVKGAPETIRQRLVKVPENYDAIYKSFTRSGSRVLALASKALPKLNQRQIDDLDREEVEEQLNFDGFMIFHCPLKNDAIETIEMLNESAHRSVMITGDNPLTAVHVAREVRILERETLILDYAENVQSNKLVFRNVEETITIPFDPESGNFEQDKIFAKYDVAATGHALNALKDHAQLRDLIRHTWVYARVSPTQKEFILNTLKDMGYQTLMCGDGTNDVGALKQAHVGIALLNGSEEGMKKMAEQRKIDSLKTVYEKQCDLLQRWGQPQPVVPDKIAHLYPPGPKNPHYLDALEKSGATITPEMRKLVEEANSKPEQAVAKPADTPRPTKDDLATLLSSAGAGAGSGDDDVPSLKLGDASCAAPFTSKLANVSAVTNIIRQGRCALINTIQMYKILALNCLISAYSLSVMYLAGVKFGDGQATTCGILLSVCFLSISRGKPLHKLAKERPQAGIFNTYIMGSILSQFAVHIIVLIYITTEIYKLEPREPQVDLEKEFSPSLLNTGIFIIQLVQQVSTFAVNYQGEPFRENIRNNKGMYYGLIGVSLLAFCGATEFIPELNDAMKFVPMDDDFKFKLTLSLALDFVGSWVAEHFFKHFFMNDKAADITHRTIQIV